MEALRSSQITYILQRSLSAILEDYEPSIHSTANTTPETTSVANMYSVPLARFVRVPVSAMPIRHLLKLLIGLS